MEFQRISKKSIGPGLAGGLEISPDLENPRNFKKIQGISIKNQVNPIDLEAAGEFSTILEANP